jgi:hypothetical protein
MLSKRSDIASGTSLRNPSWLEMSVIGRVRQCVTARFPFRHLTVRRRVLHKRTDSVIGRVPTRKGNTNAFARCICGHFKRDSNFLHRRRRLLRPRGFRRSRGRAVLPGARWVWWASGWASLSSRPCGKPSTLPSDKGCRFVGPLAFRSVLALDTPPEAGDRGSRNALGQICQLEPVALLPTGVVDVFQALRSRAQLAFGAGCVVMRHAPVSEGALRDRPRRALRVSTEWGKSR